MFIIDSHAHVYPHQIAQKAANAIGKFYNQQMLFDGQAETLIKEGTEVGINHFVISSVATTVHQVESVNAYIAKTVKENSSYFSGLGTLHPDSTTIKKDLDDLLNLGLKGVKLHPDMIYKEIDSPSFMKIFEVCENRCPVLCHVGDKRFDYSNPNRVVNILKAFPKLKFIGAHFGGWSLWNEAYKKLIDFPNMYTDCSSSLFAMTPKEAEMAIKAYGANRVLFGTDFPMWSAKQELNYFENLQLSQDEKEMILYKNAQELFAIKLVAPYNDLARYE